MRTDLPKWVRILRLKPRVTRWVIPPKANRKTPRSCDFALCCERNLVERFFNKLNRPIDANHAAVAIRKHWGIENRLHYTRDVTLREDASRIRKNPGVFARMRSFAYNILRFNQSDTIAQDRYAAALGGLKSLFSMSFSK